MWVWMTSGRTSARWAVRARTAAASSGSSMTVTVKPCRWSLRTALPPTARRPTRRSGPCRAGVISEKRCSWAPPFVPVARISTTRTRPRAGQVEMLERDEARGPRRAGRPSGGRLAGPRRGGRAAAGSARRPSPTRTCSGSSPRRKSKRRAPASSARSTSCAIEDDAGRQLARVGVDAGVVVHPACPASRHGSRRRSAGRPTVRNDSRDRPGRRRTPRRGAG